MVPNERRTELPNNRRAESRVVCSVQERRLMEIVASEMSVHLAQNCIVFQERCDAARCAWHRKSDIDPVAKVAGVSQIVAGRRRGGREQRMAVAKCDTTLA